MYGEETIYTPSAPQQDQVLLHQHVWQAGITRGVRTIVIAPSLIYGDAFDLPYTSWRKYFCGISYSNEYKHRVSESYPKLEARRRNTRIRINGTFLFRF